MERPAPRKRLTPIVPAMAISAERVYLNGIISRSSNRHSAGVAIAGTIGTSLFLGTACHLLTGPSITGCHC